jgi:hypothetical protein
MRPWPRYMAPTCLYRSKRIKPSTVVVVSIRIHALRLSSSWFVELRDSLLCPLGLLGSSRSPARSSASLHEILWVIPHLLLIPASLFKDSACSCTLRTLRFASPRTRSGQSKIRRGSHYIRLARPMAKRLRQLMALWSKG